MSDSNNPLRRHFRQASIHLRLPSQGKFYKQNTLDLPSNLEIPVLPMTAVDEIVSRTPDALFNGSAVVEIIKSCIPNVKDAWAVPAIDINAMLVAIRLASYGHTMEIGTQCPACQHESEYNLDLRSVMDSFGAPDYDKPLTVGDLTILFKPMTYFEINENSRMQFEDQKLMQSITNAELTEDQRITLIGDSFRKLTNLTVRAIGLSIASIRTPDAFVTDPNHIEEFLHNCDKNLFSKIRDYAVELRQASEIKPFDVKCQNCNHEYKQDFTLDMSNFFETNS